MDGQRAGHGDLLNEPVFYQLTKFDGTTIRIQNGTVTTVSTTG